MDKHNLLKPARDYCQTACGMMCTLAPNNYHNPWPEICGLTRKTFGYKSAYDVSEEDDIDAINEFAKKLVDLYLSTRRARMGECDTCAFHKWMPNGCEFCEMYPNGSYFAGHCKHYLDEVTRHM